MMYEKSNRPYKRLPKRSRITKPNQVKIKHARCFPFKGRYVVVLSGMLILLIVLAMHLLHLHISDKEFLVGQSEARTVREITLPAYRGMITDRNGEPLALSAPVQSIWVNPQVFAPSSKQIKELASNLEISEIDLERRLSDSGGRHFVYLQRQLNPAKAQDILDLNIPGLYAETGFRRYYPAGEIFSHVIGFTNIDDKGIEGLELKYDDLLTGQSGSQRVLRDRRGHIIETMEVIKEPTPGQNLSLSLDRRLQYWAYTALVKAVNQHDAQGGSLVMIDVLTGEILAMVNQPGFNPNDRQQRQSKFIRNRAVTDLFEPGSVLKPFAAVSVLEHKVLNKNQVINTSPGFMKVSGHVVRDLRDYGALTLEGILTKSSNVGITKASLDLRAGQLNQTLGAFGFGQISDSGFPGERAGSIVVPPLYDKFTRATQSFGYGVTVTTLQLAQAYAKLANPEFNQSLTFVKRTPDNTISGQNMLPDAMQHASKEVLSMLDNVVASDGSGSRAQIPGYWVAGKTGTAHKVGEQGYDRDKYRSVFAGVAPASNPRLAMVVVIDEPQGKQYYGGLIAAPVFQQVMSVALRILDIAPDNLQSEQMITHWSGDEKRWENGAIN